MISIIVTDYEDIIVSPETEREIETIGPRRTDRRTREGKLMAAFFRDIEVIARIEYAAGSCVGLV